MKVSCKQSQSKRNTSHNESQIHSTFNIHIHVPQFDPTASVVYLPQIQPIIHLHFDEFSAKTKIDRRRLGEKSFEKKIKHCYKLLEPKFGDVKLYFGNGNKSKEKNVEETEITNINPYSSQGPYNDTEPNEYEIREKIQNGCSDKNDIVIRRNSNSSTLKANSKNGRNLKINSKYMRNKDFKLKEARVVLTDILKSKKYKCAAVASGNSDSVMLPYSKNDSSSNSLHPVENISERVLEFENHAIKLETELNNDQPLALDWDENNSDCSKNDSVDNLNNHDATEINNKSETVETPSKNRSLTSMVEGLNFSEILSRFRGHKGEFIDLIKLSNCKVEDETPEVENCVQECKYELNEKSEFKDLEENEAEYQCHTSFDIKDVVLKQDDNLDGSAAMENSSFVTIREKIDDLNTHNISDYKDSGLHYVVCSTPKDTECETVVNRNKISCSESDSCEVISEKQSNPENMDLDVVKLDSFGKMPLPVQKTNSELKKKIKERFTTITNSMIELELIRKEFQRRNLCMPTSHEIKRKEMSEIKYATNTTSSKRRMKCSGSRSKSKDTVISSESYIALEASGPTNFGVTPLNQVMPNKMHSARNFKNEMLFGNRIKRFSSPKDLKMYKLKQQASRKSVN